MGIYEFAIAEGWTSMEEEDAPIVCPNKCYADSRAILKHKLINSILFYIQIILNYG